jgi:hypothetical protein
MIISIFFIVFILFVWFDTNAFIDYSRLFKLNKIFYIDMWDEYRIINPRMDYLNYLSTKHRNFLIKMITCKPCFTFWLTIIFLFLFNIKIILFPIVYLGSYLIYNLYTYILWKLQKS